MNSEKAFTPLGDTILVAADTSAPTGKQAPLETRNSKKGAGCFRIYNTGSVVVHLGYGKDATEATANSVAPTAGTAQKCIPLAPGSVEIYTLTEDAYFSGLAGSASSVFITPGLGV